MDQKIFWKLSYGLYVVTSKRGEQLNGQIANTVFQISSDPPTVGISLNKNNLTREFVDASKVFAVSILPLTTPLDFIGHFGFKSGREIDKFAGKPYKTAVTGAPLITEHTLGFIEAEVIDQIDVVTHTIFIGKVVNAEVYSDDEPMTYAQYHLLKKGSTPAEVALNRPSSEGKAAQVAGAPPASQARPNSTSKYACQVCGYVYNPEVGDGHRVAPGTAFADLPDDWVCPVCGVSKEHFAPVD